MHVTAEECENDAFLPINVNEDDDDHSAAATQDDHNDHDANGGD